MTHASAAKQTITSRSTITEADAAMYTGMSRAFLRVSRRRTGGPAFLRVGRAIRYRTADLDAWLDRHRIDPWAEGQRNQ